MRMQLKNLIKRFKYSTDELGNTKLDNLLDYFGKHLEVNNIILVGVENLKVLRKCSNEYKYTLIDSQQKLNSVKFGGTKLALDDIDSISNEDLSNSIVISNCIFSETNINDLLNIYKGWSAISQLLLIIEKDKNRNNNSPIGLMEIEQLMKEKHFSETLNGYCNLSDFNSKQEFIIIAGKMTIKNQNLTKKRILAIVSMFNEKDIIIQSIKKLIEDGIYVHVVDNWSTDGGFEEVVELSKVSKNITFERFPDKPETEYKWDEILKRKQDIAREMKFDWYLHCDADEIRRSPWSNNLSEAITTIDSMGFNAIDFTVIDFRPVVDGYTEDLDPEQFFKYFEFGKRPGHFLQVKGWKAHREVNIVDEGGHNASFPGKKIYPFKFLLKHYPLRSIIQGNTKIFKDRLPRVERIMKETGWHTHYKILGDQNKFIWSKDELVEFNKNFDSEYILERLTGVGII